MEVTGGDIPPAFQELIYKSTHSVNAVQSYLRHASLILLVLSMFGIILLLNYFRKRPQASPVVDVQYTQHAVQWVGIGAP